jgi:hypothetical protein
MPPLHSVGLRIERIQWTIPHLDTLGINLVAFIDCSQCTVPSVSEIFAVGSRLLSACEP